MLALLMRSINHRCNRGTRTNVCLHQSPSISKYSGWRAVCFGQVTQSLSNCRDDSIEVSLFACDLQSFAASSTTFHSVTWRWTSTLSFHSLRSKGDRTLSHWSLLADAFFLFSCISQAPLNTHRKRNDTTLNIIWHQTEYLACFKTHAHYAFTDLICTRPSGFLIFVCVCFGITLRDYWGGRIERAQHTFIVCFFSLGPQGRRCCVFLRVSSSVGRVGKICWEGGTGTNFPLRSLAGNHFTHIRFFSVCRCVVIIFSHEPTDYIKTNSALRWAHIQLALQW